MPYFKRLKILKPFYNSIEKEPFLFAIILVSLLTFQMFFEDHIDDAKYCGHLYGLGSGSSYVQNGTGNAYEEEANKQSWHEMKGHLFDLHMLVYRFYLRLNPLDN